MAWKILNNNKTYNKRKGLTSCS